MKRVAVSVVIPVSGQEDLLGRCLSSLKKMRVYPEEVIVIDGGSGRVVEELVEGVGGEFEVRHVSESEVGPGQARSLGAEIAKGDFIAFLDGDCEVGEDWVEEVERRLEKNEGKLVQGAWENVLVGKGLTSKLYWIVLEVYRKKVEGRFGFLDTRNFCVERKVWEEEGLEFNRNLSWNEQVDLGLQAREKGLKVVFCEDLRVEHLVRKGWFELIVMIWKGGVSKGKIEDKWGLRRRRGELLGEKRSEWVAGRRAIERRLQEEAREELSEGGLLVGVGLRFLGLVRFLGYFWSLAFS